MTLNIDKTSVMTIGTNKRLSNIQDVVLYLNNTMLSNVKSQKLLGISIDNNLSWNSQINQMCKNISRKITLLKMLSKYVPRHSLEIYYKSYVLPITDYACVVWGRTSDYNINRLIKLQKRAARIILKAHFLTPSSDMFKELNWLPLDKRVRYHTGLTVYKALNGLTPQYISSLINKVPSTDHKLRSSSKELLSVPKSRTQIYSNSFSINGPKEWNSLPLTVRTSSSLESFKRTLKKHHNS